jgi:hypothetical protein
MAASDRSGHANSLGRCFWDERRRRPRRIHKGGVGLQRQFAVADICASASLLHGASRRRQNPYRYWSRAHLWI